MTESGIGGLTPSVEGSEVDHFVPVEDDERQFGRYQLRYEIASGGMATVYLARSKGPAGFDRAMALKRIHPHLAKKREFVEMFLDEARLSARITHPNVCSVFDFGEVDGTYFMAMEYLVGQPLNQLLRGLHRRPDIARSPRWYALAAKIIADACEGLHAAHELNDERGQKLGVVHRDCTPHNIFVTYDGAVKVVDFGVAFAAGRLHQTQTGSLKGKLAYMSPEQVRGQAIDRRTDVWALGVCLWELITVQRLFGKRQEVEMIQAVAHDPITPPSFMVPGIPDELDRIAMRALDRTLEDRYPTARAMARDLNAYVSGSGVSAGLADLSELMEDVFARERETKLGVVASVLQTSSDVVPTSSGQRFVVDVTIAPALAGEVRPSMTVTTAPIASNFAPAPPPLAPPPSTATNVPSWIWAAALGGVMLVALAGVVATLTRATGPSSTPLPVARASITAPVVAPATTLVLPPEQVAIAAPPTETAPARIEPIAPTPSEHIAPRTGPGTIAISVTGGWADIYVDGALRGRTPRQLQVPAGRHDVELRPSGTGAGQHQTVNVRPGATSRVTARLGG